MVYILSVEKTKMLERKKFKTLDTGWMAPNGDFFPAGYMEHLSVADEIWEEYYGEVSPNDVEQQLIKKNYVCIRCVTFMEHGFVFDFDRHLTSDQLGVIKPVVESSWDRLIKSAQHDLTDEFERV